MKEAGRPKQLVLIRHAESDRNAAKKKSTYFADDEARKTVRGIPDHEIEITDRGRLQSTATGKAVRERFGTPDYFYDSGYVRTVQTRDQMLGAYTAKELAKINVRSNLFIRERDPGYTYDMTTEEAEAAFPWLKEYWETFGGFFARPPGGESLADVTARVYKFVNMLFRDRADQNVFAVIHGGTLRAMRFLLERWTYQKALSWKPDESPENCGVTAYAYCKEREKLVLIEYNKVYWQ